jgi:hypothetical protein
VYFSNEYSHSCVHQATCHPRQDCQEERLFSPIPHCSRVSSVPMITFSVAERVNGRAAMIGFTSAVIDEVMTGNSISTQFHDNIGLSIAVASLAFLGTAANPKDEGYVQGFWKPETELVNGRLAMVGIASLLLTESIHPHVPLF